MAKLRKRHLVGLMLLLSVALVTYAWNTLPDGPRWQRRYPQIAVGDSEQKVLEMMGKPSEIRDCERPRYSGNQELWQKCAEEYWYITPMQTWAFAIGKDGKVIAKWYNVSP